MENGESLGSWKTERGEDREKFHFKLTNPVVRHNYRGEGPGERAVTRSSVADGKTGGEEGRNATPTPRHDPLYYRPLTRLINPRVETINTLSVPDSPLPYFPTDYPPIWLLVAGVPPLLSLCLLGFASSTLHSPSTSAPISLYHG